MSSRLQILEAQTRKFNLGDDVILLEVARFLPDTVTGSVAIRYIYGVSLSSMVVVVDIKCCDDNGVRKIIAFIIIIDNCVAYGMHYDLIYVHLQL